MSTVAAEEKDKQEKELEEQDMAQQEAEAETPQAETTGEPSTGDEEKAAKSEKKEKKKKDKKQDALKEKVEELEDRVKRQMAEFDNFRKRTEKEKTAMFETGAKSVIEKILPVVDNFERGLASVPEEEKDGAIAQGMQMIYKQLMTELENLDVKPIPAVGEEFNPEFHNAVMQTESEEFESGVIAQELQKGYTYRDSVVRHSMVAVVE
ncbi:MAG: nucleotide exchange factor GrpE [Lachnospiraceae bacterium]|nr:nucleotide exchange factor GrpE [Lachnospiraceae bacterium]